MKVIVFDTETTGIDSPELIEAAFLVLAGPPRAAAIASSFEHRYKPSKPISYGAMATHHIIDEDLADCPPASNFALPSNVEYLVGHNVDFDWKVIGSPNIKRIDTLALCRDLWPQVDSHKQSAMLYFFDRATARAKTKDAHSALQDVHNCLEVLNRILAVLPTEIDTWGALWRRSEEARVPKVMPFGKHKGTPIAEVPADYLRWLQRQADVDPYLLQAISR